MEGAAPPAELPLQLQIASHIQGLGSTASGILTVLYLVTMMFSVGIGMRVGRAVQTPARLGARVRGLFLNLVLVPAVAIILTRSLGLTSDVGLALLLVAVSAGGRFAPHLTGIAGGQVALATQQTALLARLTVLTAPLTARWLLGLHDVDIATLSLIGKGFLLQAVPLEAGKALVLWRPELGDRLERPLRRVVLLTAMATLLAFVATSGLGALRLLGDRGWLAVLALAAASLLAGALLGGRDRLVRRTFVIGALSRNLALALLLAGAATPGRNLQIAVFGVWWITFAIAYLFARLARRATIV